MLSHILAVEPRPIAMPSWMPHSSARAMPPSDASPPSRFDRSDAARTDAADDAAVRASRRHATEDDDHAWVGISAAARTSTRGARTWNTNARERALTTSATIRTTIDPTILQQQTNAAARMSAYLQRDAEDAPRASAAHLALRANAQDLDFVSPEKQHAPEHGRFSEDDVVGSEYREAQTSLRGDRQATRPAARPSLNALEAMQAEARESNFAGSVRKSIGKRMQSFRKSSGRGSSRSFYGGNSGSASMYESSLNDSDSSRTKRQKKKNKKYRKSPGVIAPTNKFVQRWQGYIAFLLCYIAVATPLEVGFFEPSFNFFFYCNQIIALSFLFDMISNLFIALYDHRTNHYVYCRSYIAEKYFKSWFVVDAVSVIPFDALYLGIGTTAFSRLSALRIFRLLRLAKLVRMNQLGKMFDRVELVYTIDYTMLALVKFALTAVMFAHWLACAYGLVEELEGSKYSWMRSTEFGNVVIGAVDGDPRDIVSSWDLYVAALYWSTMTISTIGYGDIVPVTMVERVYVIIAMLVGAFEYGYIVGAVSNIIATRNEKINKFQMVMRDLNAFLTDHNLPQHLRVRLREYFKYQLQGTDGQVHLKLLDRMSPALRGECTISMNKWMRELEFFRYCPEPLVISLSMQVTEQMYPPQEFLFQAGDVITKMFLIRKGVISVDGRLRLSGKTVCETCLYLDEPVYYAAQAVTYAEIFTLERQVFHNALENFPASKQFFRMQGIKKTFRNEMLAYCKAWHALKTDGVHAKLDDMLNKRPAHYLKKLRLIYGEDGEGMENSKILDVKTKAAILIQKRFRGMIHRVLLHRVLVERDVQGIFHKMLRERDPVSYTARAIDVFHARIAYSLTEVHRKLNAMLDEVGAGEIQAEKRSDSLMSSALRAASGKAMMEKRVIKPGLGTTPSALRRETSLAESSQARETSAPENIVRAQGWSTQNANPPELALQARVEELTARLVPLDRRITSAQAKQSAALAETNERLNDLSSQLEMLLKLTVTNMESGITETREARSMARGVRDLSPPPASEASRR
jgi:CRP-like cAMP-binding protein